MSKKLGISILIIGGIIILLGIVLTSINVIKEATSDKDNKKEIEQVEGYISDVDKNKSEKFNKKHCLEKLCIEKLDVITDNNAKLSVVKGKLKNTSNESVPASYIKIVFTLGTETYEEILYHQEIPAEGTYTLEWLHKNEQLLQASDYKLEKPTENEIAPLESKHN